MSNKNALGKLYDRLTPEERFSLDVEAMARGDEEESRRLVDTCPRHNYTMTDLAFSGRWMTTLEMVLALCVELTQHMSRLTMLDAIREVLPYARVVYRNEGERAYLEGHEAGSRYAWGRAGMSGDPPGWEPLEDDLEESEVEDCDPALEGDLDALTTRLEEVDIMPEILGRVERKTTRQAWTLWEAFAGFVETSLEVAPEKLIKVLLEPALSGVEDLKERKKRLGVKSDEEHLAEYETAFSEMWDLHLKKARRLSR
jgi:hypothetical protein